MKVSPATLAAVSTAVLALALAGACGGATSGQAAADPAAGSSMPSMPAMASASPGGSAAAFPSSSPVAANQVSIQNFAFSPAVVTVRTGTTVTWTNHDEEPHTVVFTGPPGARSKALQMGDSFSYTFTAAGSFAYICSIHPQMHGGVMVTG